MASAKTDRIGETGWQRARNSDQQKQRKKEIIDAVHQLYPQNDFDSLSLNAIAEAAGLSKTSLYLYFKTREEIFLEIFNSVYQNWISDVVQVMDELPADASPTEIAGAWIEASWNNQKMRSLTPMLQSTIETNVPKKALQKTVQMKIDSAKKLHGALLRFIPTITGQQSFELMLFVQHLYSQFVANDNNRRLHEALAEPEFAYLKVDFKKWCADGVAKLIDSYRENKKQFTLKEKL